MKRLPASALAAALLLAAAPASAQQVTLARSPALDCLTPPAAQRGAPEYPFDAWKRGDKGRVKVALVFGAPDRAPAVEVLSRQGDGDSAGDFVDAVRRHVATLRVPCLADVGGSARLEYEFLFEPDGRQVTWAAPQDSADAVRRAMLGCIVHYTRESRPEYPDWARRAELHGNVLAQMRFDALDRPPQVEVHARPSLQRLKAHIAEWASGYRMPCHEGAPVSAVWTFSFRFVGAPAYGFKDLDLTQLLPRVKGVLQQRLAFDTTTMSCPFDLRLVYRRPMLPNVVGEVGSLDPARRPLLEWLAGIELDLPAASLDAVFGDTAALHVPCLKIDLKPKE